MTIKTSRTLFDASDKDIENALECAELPTLLPSLAYLTGDLSLLSQDLQPPLVPAAVGRPSQGGLSVEQQIEIRRMALEVLKQIRDSGSLEKPYAGEANLLDIVGYLTGDIPQEYLPLLLNELGLPEKKATAQPNGSPMAVPFSVIVIGAGMSGLCAAYQLDKLGIAVTILEKNTDVGGTWFENKYPGCRLDTGNFAYSYSFAQKNDWPSEYSERNTVLSYFREFAQDTKIKEKVVFNSEVIGATFDEDSCTWQVSVRGDDGKMQSYVANFIISAVGQLNKPKLPDIAGRDSFKGETMHTAQWNSNISLMGKRVAVIGTGASAYQVIPSISNEVKELFVFQRSAPWLLPTPNYHESIPEGQRWLFEVIPHYHNWFRFYQFWTNIKGRYRYSKVDPSWDRKGGRSVSEANQSLRDTLENYLRSQFEQRPEMLSKVIPDYAPYSKRMLRDNGSWAKTLMSDHVRLVTEGIERITEVGIQTKDGNVHEVDVIIYGTGFYASDFLEPMKITGLGGTELHEYWKGDARAYLGIMVPMFPNLFCIYGPNTNFLTNGSITVASESAVSFAIECILMLASKGKKSISCREDVYLAYNQEIDAANEEMAWGIPEASSWYKNSFGRVSQNWPLPLLDYWLRTKDPQPNQFEIQ